MYSLFCLVANYPSSRCQFHDKPLETFEFEPLNVVSLICLSHTAGTAGEVSRSLLFLSYMSSLWYGTFGSSKSVCLHAPGKELRNI